jgi:hypothetical protein
VQSFTSSSSNAVTAAAGIVPGDLIILACIGNAPFDSSQGIYSCSGFTKYSVGIGIYGIESILYRIADGTEGSTFTVSNSNSHPCVTAIAQIVVASAAIDVIGSGNVGYNSTPSDPGISISNANELVIWIGTGLTGGNLGIAIPAPASYTSQAAGTSGTNRLFDILVYDNKSLSSGATGTITSSGTATGTNWGTTTLAVKPVTATPKGGLLAMT